MKIRKILDILEAAPPQAGAVGAFGKNPNAPATSTAQPATTGKPVVGTGLVAGSETQGGQVRYGSGASAQPAAKPAAAPAAQPAAAPAAQPAAQTKTYGAGYDPSKVQYAYGGPSASAQQSAASDASKKNIFGGGAQTAQQPVNNQSSGMTAQAQAQKTPEPTPTASQQPVNNQSSGMTAQSQQKTPEPTPTASQPPPQTSDQIATAALNAPDQGTSGTALGRQAAFGKMAEEEELEEELAEAFNDLLRLSSIKLNEKAVSKQQQKFMGMVHAMQKGEKVKGASPELKKVAKTMGKKDAKDFASTKHKGLPQKVSEGVNFVEMMRETEQTLEEMLTELHDEITEFKMTGHMRDKLRDVMELHRHSKNKLMGEANMVYEDDALNELAALAGLEEDGPGQFGMGQNKTMHPSPADIKRDRAHSAEMDQKEKPKSYQDRAKKQIMPKNEDQELSECGDMDMDSHTMQKDRVNITTNMSSDGTKDVVVNAQGDAAEDLLAMLKLAGMQRHDKPAMVMIDTDEEMMEREEAPVPDDGRFDPPVDVDDILNPLMDEELEEAKKKRITRHSNTPDEEYQTVDSILRQGADLNREKRQYKKEYPGDNPMAESMLDSDLNDILESILIRDDDTPAKLLFTPKSIDRKTGSDWSGYNITSPRTGRVGAKMEPGEETKYYAADPLPPDDVTGATIKNHGKDVEWHRGEKGVKEQSGNQPNPYPVGQDVLTPQQKLNPTNNPNKSIVQGIKDFIMNPLKPGM